MTGCTKKTLLLVEDDTVLAMAQKLQLEKYGYYVQIAATGEQAVEAVDTSPGIDLVLMDINLGDGMDGTQAAGIILGAHDIPILFVSSHSDRETVEKTEKITSYGYVVKNSSITVLDASIKMAFKLFDAKRREGEKEKALKIKEDRLSKIMIAANDGMWDWDLKTNHVFFDPRYYTLSGYEVDDFPHSLEEFQKRIHLKDHDYVMNEAHRHLSGKIDRFDVTFRFLEKSGKWQWIQGKGIVVERDEIGNPSRFIGTHRDVTAQKMLEISLQTKNEDYEVINEELRSTTEELLAQNESMRLAGKALQESKEQYRRLVENSHDIIYILTSSGHFNFVSAAWTSLLGHPVDQVIGKSFEQFVHPDDIAECSLFLRKVLETGKQQEGVEYRVRHIDGSWRWHTSSAVPLQDEAGIVTGFEGMARDTTEQKLAYIRLRESIAAFNLLLNSVTEGIYGVDEHENCTFCNQSCLALLGYTRQEELLGKNMHRLIHGKHANGSIYPVEECPIARNLDQGRGIHIDDEVFWRADDTFFHAEYWSNPQLDNGRIVGAVISFLDITERKKTEAALRDSQERLRFALEVSGLGEWELNLETNTVKRNERWAEMLGYSLAEVDDSFKQGVDLQHPDDREAVQKAVKDHHEGRTDSFKVNCRMKTKSGNYKWIQDCGKIYERDKDGKPVRICGTHMDIDDQKQAEEVIATARNLLASILESSPEIIVFALDTQYRYLAFNSKHKAAIQYIWGKEIAVGMSMLDIFGTHEDGSKAKKNFDRALHGESFVAVEDYGDEELSRQSWLDYWSPIRNNDDEIIGLTCFVLNNTEQKKAETRIQSLLAEKELILKEVHHRIKNNMNTLSSLLSLQAGTIPEPEVIRALEDARSRIHSMSLLYDKLYRSTDYSELSIREYLSSLVDDILENFPNNQKCTIEKKLQDFELDAKHLQPLGIIINELITNIMKYAFKDRETGLITVVATKSDRHIAVSVQDNGVGIPESVSFDGSTGFGLQLVQALTQQLKGTIRIERTDGTRIIVEFDL
jgi:PAS domain S-box-containing protein